ncbi:MULTISPECIES: LysR substrate-binding domain-containing protein [Bradyrhizobium]|jgi:DNA-binding transcriptional LysR family regulator|uniref:LysR substrate-binding domain-containing protein n=1 Tax=Bradyrhizobium TaxID=374 RepID=UPI001F0A1D76|nr:MULTISPECIES: LysR substrate-binding domain-containing protein [Bradyrhizobium]MDI2075054.1 LysR substrate-binding domain-containing protein [Bradyrhizobium sp. Mp27]
MIAVRVTRELRLAVVGSPCYFSSRSIPRKPRDLNDHRCISLRLPGGSYRWEFEKGRKAVTVGVNGPLIIDDTHLVIQAALAGAGLGIASKSRSRSMLRNVALFVCWKIGRRQFPDSACITTVVSISRLRRLH